MAKKQVGNETTRNAARSSDILGYIPSKYGRTTFQDRDCKVPRFVLLPQEARLRLSSDRNLFS